MEPGRAFHPAATSVMVQAIYDAESVAVLVRWHDMSPEKTGKNGPSLPVPPEEEEEASAAAGRRCGAGGSPFADAEVARPGRAGARPRRIPLPRSRRRKPASRRSSRTPWRSRFRPRRRPTPRKPYFLFGDAQNSVDLWFFDLARPEPHAVHRAGEARTSSPATRKELTGVASYDQGEWSVIFKRPLRPASGAAFSQGQFLPIAFSVWDGFSRERGNRRGLTTWYSVYVEPQVVPSAVGPMMRTALIILAIELAIIGWVRWRYNSRTRGDLGREPSHPAATSA